MPSENLTAVRNMDFWVLPGGVWVGFSWIFFGIGACGTVLHQSCEGMVMECCSGQKKLLVLVCGEILAIVSEGRAVQKSQKQA